MSVLSRLRLFPLNPTEGTAKGWIKVVAAYLIIGPLVGAVVAAFVFAIIASIGAAPALGSLSKVWLLPVYFLSVFLEHSLMALIAAHYLSALLAGATALVVLLLSRWLKQRTTMFVLLVPVLMVGLFYALQRAFDFELIGAQVVLLSDEFLGAAPVLAAAVAASLVSWRIATGPAREPSQ